MHPRITISRSGTKEGVGGKDGRMYVRMDGQNIPCILQDIVPLGPLPKKDEKEGKRGKYEGGGGKEGQDGGNMKRCPKTSEVS